MHSSRAARRTSGHDIVDDPKIDSLARISLISKGYMKHGVLILALAVFSGLSSACTRPNAEPTLDFSLISEPISTPRVTRTPTAKPVVTSTVTPLAPHDPDVIFSDGFEGGSFAAWSKVKEGANDLIVSSAAALVGSNGMEIVIHDTTPKYVEDKTPNAEPRYRARFYFNPNGIHLQDGDRHTIFYAFSGSTVILRIDFHREGPSYQVLARTLDNRTNWRSTMWYTISNGPHVIEFDWQAATAPGSKNGTLTFWLDGVEEASLTGLNNDTRRVDTVRLGAVSGIDAGTRGTEYFDAFESHRQNPFTP